MGEPQDQSSVRWKGDDPALLRAAAKIIRLYNLHTNRLFAVEARSVASIIAEALNQPKTGRAKTRR